MIIYNVTVKIEQSLANDWVEWMKSKHIPDVIATGLFSTYRLCRIFEDEADGGMTFATQYFCNNLDDFQKYQRDFAPALQKDHMDRYKDKYVAFRTLMEEL
jgi:hypothetical protein